MGDKTGIAWTDATWNPIVGCSVTSPGCTNCYAMKMAGRICAMQPDSHYQGTVMSSKGGQVWTGALKKSPEHILTQPLRWKKPRMIFVNSMSDLFHENVPDEWIDEVFAIMALCPQHTFQVLTKRADRMRKYFADEWRFPMIEGNAQKIHSERTGEDPSMWLAVHDLPNVWLGVSAENQKRANERIPHLLNTPAAVRFVSLEPQLGYIDLTEYLTCSNGSCEDCFDCGNCVHYLTEDDDDQLDWVIQGCESGHGARPFDLFWARQMREKCNAGDVPYFLKQIPGKNGGKIETPELDGKRWVEFPR